MCKMAATHCATRRTWFQSCRPGRLLGPGGILHTNKSSLSLIRTKITVRYSRMSLTNFCCATVFFVRNIINIITDVEFVGLSVVVRVGGHSHPRPREEHLQPVIKETILWDFINVSEDPP
jgi:hypothetical protein